LPAYTCFHGSEHAAGKFIQSLIKERIMSRLFTQAVSDATGPAAQLFAAIKRSAGMVPNAYRDIGNNSPAALEAVLTLDASLRKTSLSAQDIEVIKLAVSEAVACDYCVAAHTMIGGKTGLSQETMSAVRQGLPTGDARSDALAAFARSLVTTRGTTTDSVVVDVRAAGITDAEIVDTLLVISAITFTNLFNRVNDTTLDFPEVA
jgi:uncharacterized peroxidase-related enzyme